MRFCFFAFRFVLIGLLVASSGICFGQFAVSDNAVLRAAATGNADVLKSLMASGGRADAMTDRGEPAVYLAVQANHVESVKVLLDAGATGLNGLYGKSRFSPLTNAATADNTSMIKLLIDHGASLSLVDGGGLDPLSSAIISKSPEAVRLIADAGGDPNLRLPRGLSAPLRAAIYGDVEIEKIILDHKGNVDARDDAGASALMYAAAMGREGNVRLLLERGAKVYPLNASQRSALGEAKLFEDAEVRERIVAMLKAAGAAENNAQRPIDAQFLKAAYDGNLALVKTLLAKGADIEARGKLDGPLYLYDALSVSVKHPRLLSIYCNRTSIPS